MNIKEKHVTSKQKAKYSKVVTFDGSIYHKTLTVHNMDRFVMSDFISKAKAYKKYFKHNGFDFDFEVNNNIIEITQSQVSGIEFEGDFFDWLSLYKNFITELQKYRPQGYYLRANDLHDENIRFINDKKFILIDETKLNVSVHLNYAKQEFIYGAYAYLCAKIENHDLSPNYVSKKIIDAVEEGFYGR